FGRASGTLGTSGVPPVPLARSGLVPPAPRAGADGASGPLRDYLLVRHAWAAEQLPRVPLGGGVRATCSVRPCLRPEQLPRVPPRRGCSCHLLADYNRSSLGSARADWYIAGPSQVSLRVHQVQVGPGEMGAGTAWSRRAAIFLAPSTVRRTATSNISVVTSSKWKVAVSR